MKKIKLGDIFVAKYRLYLLIILVLLICLCVAMVKTYPLIILISIAVYALILYYTSSRRKRALDRIVNNMSDFMIKLKADKSILDFPIPAIIVNKSGEILWNNQGLEDIFKGINKEKYIESITKNTTASL